MLLGLALVLALLWLFGFVAFHAIGGLIHVLLIVAIVVLVVHFLRGRNARAL